MANSLPTKDVLHVSDAPFATFCEFGGLGNTDLTEEIILKNECVSETLSLSFLSTNVTTEKC